MNTDFFILDKEIMDVPENVDAVLDLLYPDFDFEKSQATWGIATVDEMAVGAVGFLEDFPSQIVWLYVVTEYRRKGIGTCLVNGVKQYLEEKLIISEIHTQFEVDADAEDSVLYHFFDSLEGTDILMEDAIFELEPEQIKKTVEENIIFHYKNKGKVKSARDLSKEQMGIVLSKQGISNLFEVKDLDVYYDEFQKDISFYSVGDEGIDSIILTTKIDEKTIFIDLFFSQKPMKALELINALGRKVVSDYPDCSVVFKPVNDKIYDIMEYLFTAVKIRAHVCTAEIL